VKQNILVLFFTLLLVMLCGEGAIRYLQKQDKIYDFSSGEHNKTQTKKKTFSAKFLKSENPKLFIELDPADKKINALGLRGPETTLANPDNRYRIALIGDSVAYGYGVPFKQTFGYLLQKNLNENKAFLPSTEVLNFAVSGYGLESYVEVYREKVRAFNPDLVLLVYCLNDPAATSVVFEAVGKMMQRNSSYKKIGKYSEFIAWIKFQYDRAQRNRKVGQEFGDAYEDPEVIQKINQDFSSLEQMASSDQTTLLVAIVPYFSDFNNPALHIIHDKLHSVLTENNITYTDLSDLFLAQQQPASHWRLNPEDVTHPNSAGHQLIAEHLTAWLASQTPATAGN
jgi:lysophospholipase L1-like esterase